MPKKKKATTHTVEHCPWVNSPSCPYTKQTKHGCPYQDKDPKVFAVPDHCVVFKVK